MNLENNLLNVVICSLSLAFFISKMLIEWTKDLFVTCVYRYNKYLYKRGKEKDFSLTNAVRKSVNEINLKPFSCMTCMSFWIGLMISINFGYGLSSVIVGIVGLFFGAILERYL